jgi:uncharacterized RDD family membrane protein YckC
VLLQSGAVGEERLTVATPERVTLEYELAGLGSRFAAALVDGFVQAALLGLLLGALTALGSLSCDPLLGAVERHSRGEPDALAQLFSGRLVLVAVGSLFLLQIVYHTAFEGGRDGQTPGKRLLGIRVVREGGYPLGWGAAFLRNLLRPLDFLPVFFGVGAAVALVTARTQRLGDLAARTLVVRERAQETAASLLAPPPGAAPDAALRLGAEEQALLRAFLDRRDQLDPEARARLAARLAAGFRQRHGDLDAAAAAPEGYLERLAAERAT